jgi:hypothetical protein
MGILNKCSLLIRFTLCGIVSLLGGFGIGFQGNGNLILSGLLIGVVLGLAWSILLLFGLPALLRNFHLTARFLFLGALLLAALISFPIICYRYWGCVFRS